MKRDMKNRDTWPGDSLSEILNQPIEFLKLSTISLAALRQSRFQTVGELVQQSEEELWSRGIAPYEIKDTLGKFGLSLGWRIQEDGTVLAPPPVEFPLLPVPHHGEQVGLFEEPTQPPKLADYLLYLFLPKHDRECIPGDLAEEYTKKILPEFGLWRAKFWYWSQVIRSVWPILRPRLRRLLTLAGIVRILRRLGF